MRSKYVLNKNNKNTNPEIKIQKLKISKSQFSQTQQNYQILKPRSTKLIQKYNINNPKKKILKPRKTHLRQVKPSKSSKPTLEPRKSNQEIHLRTQQTYLRTEKIPPSRTQQSNKSNQEIHLRANPPSRTQQSKKSNQETHIKTHQVEPNNPAS